MRSLFSQILQFRGLERRNRRLISNPCVKFLEYMCYGSTCAYFVPMAPPSTQTNENVRGVEVKIENDIIYSRNVPCNGYVIF